MIGRMRNPRINLLGNTWYYTVYKYKVSIPIWQGQGSEEAFSSTRRSSFLMFLLLCVQFVTKLHKVVKVDGSYSFCSTFRTTFCRRCSTLSVRRWSTRLATTQVALIVSLRGGYFRKSTYRFSNINDPWISHVCILKRLVQQPLIMQKSVIHGRSQKLQIMRMMTFVSTVQAMYTYIP